MPVVHPVCGHTHPGADTHPKTHGEWQGDPDGVTDCDRGADAGPNADGVQPTAPGLPDPAVATDPGADADAQDDPDRGRRHPDTHGKTDADAGAHDAAELNPVADRDPDAVALTVAGIRARRAAGCRSRR